MVIGEYRIIATNEFLHTVRNERTGEHWTFHTKLAAFDFVKEQTAR